MKDPGFVSHPPAHRLFLWGSRSFHTNVQDVHGDAGAAWLRRLPDIVAECERRWSLRVGPPFPDLSYNYATAAVMADGRDIVLKHGVPHDEFTSEANALQAFDGRGAARLLQVDVELGAMLLERLQPGTSLVRIDDDTEATAIAAAVMRRVRRSAPEGVAFQTVDDWAGGLRRLRDHFEGDTGPLPPHLVERSEALLADLAASPTERMLIHGDLHQYNILRSLREPWLAIDPKGVLGETEFEPAAFLRDRIKGHAAAGRSASRHSLERLVIQPADESDLDRGRVLRWAVVQSVLAAWWGIEDQGRVSDRAIAYAELIGSLERS